MSWNKSLYYSSVWNRSNWMVIGFVSVLLFMFSSTYSRVSLAFSPIVSLKQSHHYLRNKVLSMSVDDDKKTKNNDHEVTVAIIGGGIAGMSCARHLIDNNNSSMTYYLPTVFDTGRLRPGGRCSSRLPNDSSKKNNKKQNHNPDSTILSRMIVDHAAQILKSTSTSSSSSDHSSKQKWQKQIQEWKSMGLIVNFPPNSIATLTSTTNDHDNHKNNILEPMKDTSEMYYAVNGMGSIPLALTHANTNTDDDDALFPVYQDVWISPNNGVKYLKSNNKWLVQTNQQTYGEYDMLIVAHNGKCADRLMSKTPAKALHSLLRTNFAPSAPKWGGNRMTLNSIYSLTFAIPINNHHPPSSLLENQEIICTFLQNHPNLQLLTNQSNKFPNNKKNRSDYVVYTLLSSATFAKKHKGPQENLPKETIEKVTSLLFQSLEESLQLESNILQDTVVDTKLQLWGAAVPVNTYKKKDGFIYDHNYQVGVCGDWLIEPSIAGAWESGRRLAQHLTTTTTTSIGLPRFDKEKKQYKATFQSSHHSGIGNLN